jgi:hypothetical protein
MLPSRPAARFRNPGSGAAGRPAPTRCIGPSGRHEGYIHIGGHIDSVPYQLIGKAVEVRETKDQIRVFAGPREASRLVGSGSEISRGAHPMFRS